MKLFGQDIHNDDDPWRYASAREIELRCMLGLILDNQEIIMSDLTNLDTAIAALQTEVGNIGTQMDRLLADLTGAHATGNQAAIDTATAAVQAQVDALKAIATRLNPPTSGP